MKMVLRVLSVIAFVLSMLWYFSNPGYEPAISVVVSLSALLSTVVFGQKKIHEKGQNQSVGDDSAAIQAGRDVNISIRSNKDGDGEC